MNIQKYSDFKLVTEEEEGLWDTIKYGFSKLGRYKAGGKIFGKGEEELLNTCKDGTKCSDLEHKENRRTEFKFFPL